MNNAYRQTLEMAGKIPGARIAQMERKFLFHPVGTEKVEYLGRSLVCSGKFPVEPRVQFAFKPVNSVILPKCKAL